MDTFIVPIAEILDAIDLDIEYYRLQYELCLLTEAEYTAIVRSIRKLRAEYDLVRFLNN